MLRWPRGLLGDAWGLPCSARGLSDPAQQQVWETMQCQGSSRSAHARHVPCSLHCYSSLCPFKVTEAKHNFWNLKVLFPISLLLQPFFLSRYLSRSILATLWEFGFFIFFKSLYLFLTKPTLSSLWLYESLLLLLLWALNGTTHIIREPYLNINWTRERV